MRLDNFLPVEKTWKAEKHLKGSEQERPLDFSAIFESVQK